MSKNEPIKTKCISWDAYKLITSICSRNSITCITECIYNAISSPWYLHGIEIIKMYVHVFWWENPDSAWERTAKLIHITKAKCATFLDSD